MEYDARPIMAMPLSVAAMRSSQLKSCAPGCNDTFGMRWNCTSAQLCAYEQPCERTGLPFLAYHDDSHGACSRVVW